MTMPQSTLPEKLIGDANVKVAQQCLKNLGIKIIHHDTLGIEGRKISVNCAHNHCEINIISRNYFLEKAET